MSALYFQYPRHSCRCTERKCVFTEPVLHTHRSVDMNNSHFQPRISLQFKWRPGGQLKTKTPMMVSEFFVYLSHYLQLAFYAFRLSLHKALSGTVLYLPNLCTGGSPAESFGSGPLCEGPPAPALTADQKKNRSAFSDVCPSVLNYRLFKQRQHLRNFQTK